MQINNACDTRTKREAHSEASAAAKVEAWGLLVSYNASRAQSFGKAQSKIAKRRNGASKSDTFLRRQTPGKPQVRHET